MLFADDLEFSCAIPLDPTLYPSEPGVQLLEESPGSCPVQHNHNRSVRKSGLWLQEMRNEGGV